MARPGDESGAGAIHGDRVTLRPVTPEDRERLRSIRAEPEVERWWDAPTDAWPDDADDLEMLAIVHDQEVVGLIQTWEEPDPEYGRADIDIFLTSRLHGRGIGTDAMRTIARHLIEDRGHHRLTLTTSPDNARAIHVYEKLGFRRVGVTRLSERGADGTWHDELLMELVSPPPPRGRARSRPRP
jgi:aminoglycoside 6'-N-acetyltransferase